MKRAWLLALLIALPAYAAEPAHLGALIDGDCTDSFNAGGAFSVFSSYGYQTQTTGTADGLCDSDASVVKGSGLTTSQTFGPFAHTRDEGLYIHANVTSVTGGSTDWNVCIQDDSPETPGTLANVCCSQASNFTSATDSRQWFGLYGVATATAWTGSTPVVVNCAIPDKYWVKFVVGTGVTAAGSLTVQSSH